MYPQLCFSPLGTDKEERPEIIRRVTPYIDRIHWDFMDNTFVPFEDLTIEELGKEYMKVLPVDVHLMVNDPYKYLEPIKNTLNNQVCHVIGQLEVLDDPRGFLDECRSYGFKAGLALHPETPPGILEPFIMDVDSVLVLGVIPGKSGQSTIPHTLDTVQFLREQRFDIDIFFDGGANPHNSYLLIDKGANMIISGGYIQDSADDPSELKEEFGI